MLKGVATGCFTPQTPNNGLFDLGCGYEVFWDKEVIRLACSSQYEVCALPFWLGYIRTVSDELRLLLPYSLEASWLCLLPLVCLSLIHTPLFKNIGTHCAWPNTLGVQEHQGCFPEVSVGQGRSILTFDKGSSL